MSVKTWKFNRDIIRLRLEDVSYLESYRRKTIVHAGCGTYRIQTTLKKEEESLEEEGFLRAHQRYLVQLNHVRALKGNHLILCDGKRIPVSYRKREQVHERLLENM